jgi:small GTP-binding protein
MNCFKVILIGDVGIGKTSIIEKWTSGSIDNSFHIGVPFISKYVPERFLKITFWDTSGQERFRALSQSFYQGADLVVCCFDSLKSLTRLCNQWIPEAQPKGLDVGPEAIQKGVSPHSPLFILLRHKVDRFPFCSKEEEEIIKTFNFPFFETSIKDEKSLDRVLQFISLQLDLISIHDHLKRIYVLFPMNKILFLQVFIKMKNSVRMR